MSKVLTFIALSGGCLVPLFMDLGSSHLFNELWDAHARSHLVWMIASFFLIFILGSYFLFVEKNEVIPAMLSLCVLLGYAISALTINTYGGVFLGEGGVEPEPFGIPINLIHFSSMLFLQLLALILILNRNILR